MISIISMVGMFREQNPDLMFVQELKFLEVTGFLEKELLLISYSSFHPIALYI